MNVAQLTLDLCQIPSITGQEETLTQYLASKLKEEGYVIQLQPLTENRHNLLATHSLSPPKLLLTTHLDTVPPHIPPTLESGILKGRGVCDAKGIMAAMICAARHIPEAALLFLVGEETNSEGAKKAVQGFAPKVSYFINGEPTDLKIASAMKGALAFCLTASGVTGHSAYPETGHSAIHQLVHDMHTLLHHPWPQNAEFGLTTLNLGKIEGGRAPNVIADWAQVEAVMRTTIDYSILEREIRSLVAESTQIEVLTASSPLSFEKIPGFESCIVKFGSDIPHLQSIGKPVLFGPGSILDAHTAHERISVADLEKSVLLYEKLCHQLLGKSS